MRAGEYRKAITAHTTGDETASTGHHASGIPAGRGGVMGKIRSLAACVVVTCTACTSFAETAECGAPPLVGVSDTPAIELWSSDGDAEVLSDDPAASWPVLSPDGETVAIALGEGEFSDAAGWESSRVALLDVDSGEVSLLSREVPGAQVAYLQWSPSGAEVVFVRFGGDIREIVAVDLETGEERRVLRLSDGQGDFTVSPDGTEMLVPTYVDPAGSTVIELRRYFLGSGHHVVLTTFDSGIGQISWSPGGRWVAVQEFLPEPPRLRLFVLDIETGESSPVDLRRGEPMSMTWSGPYLLYVYNVGPAPELALMSWDSRTLRRAQIDRDGLERFGYGPISAPRCDSAAV
jgi:Tol biopolymer transport system component